MHRQSIINKNWLLSLFILSIILSSCTDGFEELNVNPNEPTLVPPEVIFPYAIRESVDRIHGHRTRLERLGLDGGMLWVQYFARINTRMRATRTIQMPPCGTTTGKDFTTKD